jgi:hypothetical protein
VNASSWLSFGDSHDLQIVVIEPLFEEANRCRRLMADIMRRLDARGIGSRIADLPGAGESEIGIRDVGLDDWRRAVKGYGARYVASFRGGALIDDAGSPDAIWRFSPETGARIVRDLRRATLAGSDGVRLSGHPLSDDFIEQLETAVPVSVDRLRIVRLENDAANADVRCAGAPLWRRAEPGEDQELAHILADDLAQWVKQCDAP